MIISPQGKIVAKAEGPDGLAITDIDPRGQREGGDALNWQREHALPTVPRAEPEAFHILTDTNPPVLAKVPIDLTPQEAGRVMFPRADGRRRRVQASQPVLFGAARSTKRLLPSSVCVKNILRHD